MPENHVSYTNEGHAAEKGAKCPYLTSAITADCWEIGVTLRELGWAPPAKVFKSRGNTYRAIWPGGSERRFNVYYSVKGVTVRVGA